jgi:hypothetical protein
LPSFSICDEQAVWVIAVKDWHAIAADTGVRRILASLVKPAKSLCDVSSSPQTMISGIACSER